MTKIGPRSSNNFSKPPPLLKERRVPIYRPSSSSQSASMSVQLVSTSASIEEGRDDSWQHTICARPAFVKVTRTVGLIWMYSVTSLKVEGFWTNYLRILVSPKINMVGIGA